MIFCLDSPLCAREINCCSPMMQTPAWSVLWCLSFRAPARELHQAHLYLSLLLLLASSSSALPAGRSLLLHLCHSAFAKFTQFVVSIVHLTLFAFLLGLLFGLARLRLLQIVAALSLLLAFLASAFLGSSTTGTHASEPVPRRIFTRGKVVHKRHACRELSAGLVVNVGLLLQLLESFSQD